MANLSRVQRREIAALARELIGVRKPVHVVQDSEGCSAYFWEPHDEGWTSMSVEVYATPDSRVYSVVVTRSGRDCDGPSSRTDRYDVRRRVSKRRRWYWSRDWSRNRPEGRFGMRSAFCRVSEIHSRCHDGFAAAAGY